MNFHLDVDRKFDAYLSKMLDGNEWIIIGHIFFVPNRAIGAESDSFLTRGYPPLKWCVFYDSKFFRRRNVVLLPFTYVSFEFGWKKTLTVLRSVYHVHLVDFWKLKVSANVIGKFHDES